MPTVLIAIPDLLFASKVSAAASAAGASIARASRKASLVNEVTRTDARRVLVDLAGWPGALEEIAAVHAAFPAVDIVGYCGHTRGELLAGARGAGCTLVLTQGELSARLHELLCVP